MFVVHVLAGSVAHAHGNRATPPLLFPDDFGTGVIRLLMSTGSIPWIRSQGSFLVCDHKSN